MVVADNPDSPRQFVAFRCCAPSGRSGYANLSGAAAVRVLTEMSEMARKPSSHVPESSRRFRALALWCALKAYGRAAFDNWMTDARDVAILKQAVADVRDRLLES